MAKTAALLLLACLASRAADLEGVPDSVWLLQPGDLIEPRALATRLSESADEVAECVRDYLSAETEEMLADYGGGEPPQQLVGALVKDLNVIIARSDLYRESLFTRAQLSEAAQALIQQKPRGYERMHLNRLLLEETFSNEIASNPAQFNLLKPADIINLRALAAKLRDAKDPVSRYLRDNCSDTARQQLREYRDDAPPSAALRDNLVNSLNSVLLGNDLYQKERFLSVKLAARTKALVESSPSGESAVRMNRFLIEDAYPAYIAGLEETPIDIRADSLEVDHNRNIMVGAGHVRLQKGDELLRSDHAIVNLDSYDVLAEGNVQFERGSDIWIGKKLRYNFNSQKGDFGVFSAFMDPFYVHAESSKRIGENEYLLNDAVLSTCEGEHPSSFFRAKTVKIVPGRHVRAKHVTLYVGRVPVMYSPFWSQNIGDPNFISLVPGYNSRMWAFLLTTFNYRLSDHFEAKTHLDPRARRGIAVGQDILWSSSGNAKGLSTEKYSGALEDQPWVFGMRSEKRWEKSEDEPEEKWSGDLITYYAYDLWPDEGKSHDYAIPSDRYRLRLSHDHSITEKDYLMVQANYLSDPYIIEHFFREEYKTDPEPDNYLVLGRRGQYYAASLLFRKRFNDFFTSIDRLPEATLDFTRQQVLDSPFYYEGRHSAAYLSQEWEKKLTNSSNYSSFRFDTPNTFYYPTKQFGFLNIIPRAGWRGTLYSASPTYYTNVTVTTSAGTNGTVIEKATTNVFSRRGGSQFRSMPKLGLESSFKAFKVWETYPGTTINNIRHIAEPYFDYSYTPEPNVYGSELYQFDEIDALSKMNEVKIGMRNKVQTQRFNRLAPSSRSHTVADLVNADVWTAYRFATEEGQHVFTNIFYDIRSVPVEGMELYLDGEYNQYESSFQTFNTRLLLFDQSLWRYQLEFRHLDKSNSLVNNDLTFSPVANWSYNVYARYDFEDQHLEAYGFTIQKIMECITAKVGFEQQFDDDYTIWLQFWFTQFPKVRVDVGL